MGELPHHQVLAWLSSYPIDVFCNVSSSEGLPVSLMEAASCGLPLLATDVGGNCEIVDDSVGRLIPGGSGASVIADALTDIAKESKLVHLQWRRLSRERWAALFDAEKNYARFADDLMSILFTASPFPGEQVRLGRGKESQWPLT